MNKISVEDHLPEDGQWVLVHLTKTNWGKDKGQYFQTAKFVKGLSSKEREDLPDSNNRKKTYRSEDEWANNQRPFIWDSFGAGDYFGQEVDYWYFLPENLDANI